MSTIDDRVGGWEGPCELRGGGGGGGAREEEEGGRERRA